MRRLLDRGLVMDKNTMGRKDFFKYLLGRTKSITAQVAGEILEPFHQAEETAKNMLTTPLIALDEYHDQPKLLSSAKPPLYLVGEKDKNLTAISAICKEDGFLLTYLHQEHALYCPMCAKKHVLKFSETFIETDLTVFPLAVKEGYLYKI